MEKNSLMNEIKLIELKLNLLKAKIASDEVKPEGLVCDAIEVVLKFQVPFFY